MKQYLCEMHAADIALDGGTAVELIVPDYV